jgi:hypothetical protein
MTTPLFETEDQEKIKNLEKEVENLEARLLHTKNLLKETYRYLQEHEARPIKELESVHKRIDKL